MPNYIDLKQLDFTMLGRGGRFKGVMSLEGPTHLSGHVDGDLIMKNDSDLCIQPYGVVIGEVHGRNIEIYGRVEGSIKATGTITLHASAVEKGVVQAANLVIRPGAVMDAKTYAGIE